MYDPLFLLILGIPKMVILGKKEIFARVDLWNNILQDVVEVEGRTCSPSVNVVTMCFRMSYLLFISV